MFLIFAITLGALGFTLWLGKWTLAQHDGPPAMRSVAKAIREGAEGFLATQYSAIGRYALVMAVVLYFLYLTKPTKGTLSASSVIAKMRNISRMICRGTSQAARVRLCRLLSLIHI